MSDLTEIAQKKVALRTAALALRDTLPAAERQAAAEAIATRGLPIGITPATVVSGFMPMKTEINPIPLMRKLADAGAQLALPAIAGRGKPLIMRAWKFGDPLKGGQWGIREPVQEAGEIAPDILIVPLACFDRAELEQALRRFDEGVTGIIGEGDADAVGLNSVREWAQTLRTSQR